MEPRARARRASDNVVSPASAPRRPREDQPHYGGHLGDARYWASYVVDALSRHDLPIAEIETPLVGTFPTFLVGEFVVKLFGETFDGQASYAVELGVHRLLADHADIPAAKVVGSGYLFETQPLWAYLITTRCRGVAIRELELAGSDAVAVARRLGEVTASIHQLAPPPAVRDRDLLPRLRATAVERLTNFGLPHRLVQQVPSFLEDALPASALVHADLTADHVFIEGGRLASVIDWGDAMFADPYYELVALYFDAFACRRSLLNDFLDAYGWSRDDCFSRRALQAVLEFQFNPLDSVRRLVDLDRVQTLDEVATRLFDEG